MEEGSKEEINHGDILEKRKNKLKNFFFGWIEDKYDKYFLVVFIFAIIIRLYYFFITMNQPLWWDEADYMAYAKNLAGFNIPWTITGPHSSIFPYFVAIFFKIGFSESIIKFVFEIIPSIVLVYLTYKIFALMFKDKRIALISSFLMTTFWAVLFNSMRFHVGVPALSIAFLAIYIFWGSYEKKQKILGLLDNKWAVPIITFLVMMVYSTRRGYFLFGFFFLVYMFLTRNFKDILKDKYNWISLFIAGIMFILIESFIFTEPISSSSSQYFHPDNPFGWTAFQIFKTYFLKLSSLSLNTLSYLDFLFYLFWIGFFLIFISLILSFDYLRKQRYLESKGYFFMFLSIILTLSYFIFYQRDISVGEPRWYFPLLLPSFLCISKGALFIGDYIKKYSKFFGIFIIILFIIFGGFYEIQHADLIIKSKILSYEGIKEAGLYLKEIKEEGEMFIAVPIPQPSYYGELGGIQPRNLLNKSSNDQTSFEEFILAISQQENSNLKYILVSFSEPNHPNWMKEIKYTQDLSSGQTIISEWRIPFMNSYVNFLTGEQNIIQEQVYGNITFKLLIIKQDVFIYKINHS